MPSICLSNLSTYLLHAKWQWQSCASGTPHLQTPCCKCQTTTQVSTAMTITIPITPIAIAIPISIPIAIAIASWALEWVHAQVCIDSDTHCRRRHALVRSAEVDVLKAGGGGGGRGDGIALQAGVGDAVEDAAAG